MLGFGTDLTRFERPGDLAAEALQREGVTDWDDLVEERVLLLRGLGLAES